MPRNDEDDRIKREVGRAITEARLAKGWTQEELAKLSGVKPSTIGNYEQGTRTPRLRQATLLGTVLGIPPARILLVEGDDMLLSGEEVALIKSLRKTGAERDTYMKHFHGLLEMMSAPKEPPPSPTRKRGPKRHKP